PRQEGSSSRGADALCKPPIRWNVGSSLAHHTVFLERNALTVLDPISRVIYDVIRNGPPARPEGPQHNPYPRLRSRRHLEATYRHEELLPAARMFVEHRRRHLIQRARHRIALKAMVAVSQRRDLDLHRPDDSAYARSANADRVEHHSRVTVVLQK